MLDKLKGFISKFALQAKEKINGMQQPIKWIIIGYFALVVLLVLTYYVAWIYQCFTDKIVMRDLLGVIREMIGTSMIAFVTFIGGCMVDMNANGIPDKFEKEDDEK